MEMLRRRERCTQLLLLKATALCVRGSSIDMQTQETHTPTTISATGLLIKLWLKLPGVCLPIRSDGCNCVRLMPEYGKNEHYYNWFLFFAASVFAVWKSMAHRASSAGERARMQFLYICIAHLINCELGSSWRWCWHKEGRIRSPQTPIMMCVIVWLQTVDKRALYNNSAWVSLNLYWYHCPRWDGIHCMYISAIAYHPYLSFIVRLALFAAGSNWNN